MTIELDAGYAWREFINKLEENNSDVFKNLWMTKPTEPSVGEDWEKWRYLVQSAFIEGYFKGIQKKITGE